MVNQMTLQDGEPKKVSDIVDQQVYTRGVDAARIFYSHANKLKECPGIDKCHGGKLEKTLRGEKWYFLCPLYSTMCPLGRKIKDDALDTIVLALKDIGVPRIHLDDVRNPRNTEAIELSRRWDFNNFCMFIGKSRTGKSFAAAHLIYECIRTTIEADLLRPDAWKREIGEMSKNFMWAMAYEIATYDEIRNKSLGVGFLVMDDLATEDIKGKGAIGYVLSKRHDMRRPTVITTNLTLEDIRDKYGERVYERLQDGANGNVFIISSGAYRSYEEDWVK